MNKLMKIKIFSGGGGGGGIKRGKGGKRERKGREAGVLRKRESFVLKLLKYFQKQEPERFLTYIKFTLRLLGL